MKVLLDTCVISDVRRTSGSAVVREAVERIPEDALFISVLTLGELAKGIGLLDRGKKRAGFEQWLSGLETQFSERILPVDVEVARIWGEITARLQLKGITLPAVDGLLAATALRHGLHLMTRNTRHFEATGALVVDPWQQ